MFKLIFALGDIRSVIFGVYNPKNSFHDVSSVECPGLFYVIIIRVSCTERSCI